MDELWTIPAAALVQNGFAIAVFSVRGTGESGGCFAWLQPDEQADQPILVDWISRQPWSNGRIGMYGLSYLSTTAFEAAVANPPALKTIVVAGVIPDLYLRTVTPQGAIYFGTFDTLFPALVATDPVRTDPGHGIIGQAPHVADRACPDLYGHALQQDSLLLSSDRNARFWSAHSVRDKIPHVRSAVMEANGYHDGIRWLDDNLWLELSSAPKRAVIGPWGHSWPQESALNPNPEFVHPDWSGEVVAWLDFWLKGLGETAPGIETVEYMDSGGSWHNSSSWPPVEARPEVLYMFNGELQPEPGPESGARTFRASTFADANTAHDAIGKVVDPPNDAPHEEATALCAEERIDGTAVSFISEPIGSNVLIAGNPYAYLRLESDADGGTFVLDLYALTPDFRCESGAPHGASRIAGAAADLRFLDGNFVAVPYPQDAPTMIRVDFPNVAHALPAGHQVALVAAGGDVDAWTNPAEARRPVITVHAGSDGSHLVFPIVEGSLGGEPPSLDYPPRPFSLEPRVSGDRHVEPIVPPDRGSLGG